MRSLRFGHKIHHHHEPEQIAVVLHAADILTGENASPVQFERAECAIDSHNYNVVGDWYADTIETTFPVDRFADRSWWGDAAAIAVYNGYVELGGER